MLCTYVGPGTEWLPLDGSHTHRPQLDLGGAAMCRVARITTGVVAVMKGEATPATPETAAFTARRPRGRVTGRACCLCRSDQMKSTRWKLRQDCRSRLLRLSGGRQDHFARSHPGQSRRPARRGDHQRHEESEYRCRIDRSRAAICFPHRGTPGRDVERMHQTPTAPGSDEARDDPWLAKTEATPWSSRVQASANRMPVAATFDFRDEAGYSLADLARLDTVVGTVIKTGPRSCATTPALTRSRDAASSPEEGR